MKDALAARLDAAAPHAVRLSRLIHGHPELGFEEHRAAAWTAEPLADAGFDVSVGAFSLPTSLLATYGTGERVITLCAEYDALPDIGHACGHNLIAGVAVAAALALAPLADDLGITVRVLGTPAEETGGGKVLMLSRGAFDGSDVVLMAHPGPYDCVRPRFVACGGLTVRYQGRAAHAALNPHDGVNAADALTVAQVAIGLLRQHMGPGEFVHGVTTAAGSAPNVVPDLASAVYNVRAPDLARLSALTDRVSACFEAGALATGAQVTVSPDAVVYAELRSDAELARRYEDNWPGPLPPRGEVFGSTDFGNVSQVLPALHPIFSIGRAVANHHPGFTAAAGTPEAERAMLAAARALAWSVADLAAPAPETGPGPGRA
ncbi:M20 family metallopeptidase [Planotetraspora sp. A-T 1434]|uniref:M20 family metallopeptidase n=1 Tax=Planotetraspora sp. A-T 1434 TaxID=2979219 RepID=UPI0021C206CF|nr:M20 family metallopeptidase [Planotetraspora sp. A-T 1434]MCT9930210.1 M20 family metallopeptidase [Planotetraspora sp. A-T 1434]